MYNKMSVNKTKVKIRCLVLNIEEKNKLQMY